MMLFTQSILHAMESRNNQKAITFFRGDTIETELTFGQLREHADNVACYLSTLGISKGDRVILFLLKSLMFITMHLAIQQLGAVSVPLNPGFKQREMQYLLKDAAPKVIIAEPEKTAFIRDIDPDAELLEISTQTPYQTHRFLHEKKSEYSMPELFPDDPALIIYTSGTTGDPKGAILTQNNLMHDAANIIHIWEISPNDVICHALPLFHVHGLCFALHTALLSGAHVCMLDRFDPKLALAMLSSKDPGTACNVFMAVPAMYTKIMDEMGNQPADFKHIRFLASGSAPLLEQEFARMQTLFGIEPVEREGMSETGMNFSNPLKGRRKPGSIGKPLPGLAVRIVDPETFKDVALGQIGEIWLKGPGITPGYWQQPAETRKAFASGWFRTGDLGKVDEDGYYFLTDRIKHIIITGGENVSAKEVEIVINQMDHILESSVVGIPDEKWGEKVVAAVVTRSAADVDAEWIIAFCKERLHDWKCPKQIRFIDKLPRNTMGKVLKEAVKELFIS
jgi:malonyl-CoA/methylmalonyl-CoA synthetase